MYVTTRFVGTKRGTMNYLFFLLTEDYIEENKRITESLAPLLARFAREIGDQGALVKPFQGDEATTLDNALKKNWSDAQVMRMRKDLPALLVIDEDFDAFDPTRSNYIYISLRTAMDDFGNVRIFDVQELLDILVDACSRSDLFAVARGYLAAQNRESLWEAVELKPEFVGFSFDLKKGVEFLKRMRQNRQLFRVS